MVNSVQFHNTGIGEGLLILYLGRRLMKQITFYLITTVRALNKKTRNRDSHIRDLEESAIYTWKWVCKHFGSADGKVSQRISLGLGLEYILFYSVMCGPHTATFHIF